MFKPGDKIKILDDDQKGVVVRIHKNRVTILNELGFEETFNEKELIPDKSFEVGEVKRREPETSSENKSVNNLQEIREIDLHIGQLVDSYTGLSNYEMLQIQLQKVKNEIDLARKEKRSRLIFIHGHGSGKLKNEFIKLLETYPRLEYYDASFRKYKLGATEVRLHG